MNRGPRKIVISIAAIPAIRISPRSIGRGAGDLRDSSTIHGAFGGRRGAQLVGDQLEADRARALDQHRVARLDEALDERGTAARASGAQPSGA